MKSSINNKNMNKQLLIIIGIALLLGIVGLWYLYIVIPRTSEASVNSFEECVKLHPVITLQYPAQCTTKDGRTFIDSTTPTPTSTPTIGMANPASVNCVQNGGLLQIVEEANGQVGMCTLPSGRVCEEWAFFRGDCK